MYRRTVNIANDREQENETRTKLTFSWIQRVCDVPDINKSPGSTCTVTGTGFTVARRFSVISYLSNGARWR